MEKRGLLGAVAMAAVQNLHTLPTSDSGAGATAGDTAAAAAAAPVSRGKPATGRQSRGRGAAAAAAPKASAAVAEMLDTASGCEDMDEIFKSLSAVLAEAQTESRQVCASVCGFSSSASTALTGSPMKNRQPVLAGRTHNGRCRGPSKRVPQEYLD